MLTESGVTFNKCIVALGRCDLRCGVDGLAARIRLQYDLDPLDEGTLFLFCGRRKDRLKGLLWCGDRFILLYIRLADGRFQWPQTADEARQITGDQFLRLMDGYSIDPSIGPKQSIEVPDKSRKKKKH